MRVLVTARDVRFLHVARFVLDRRGHEVTTSRRISDLAVDVAAVRPNVVVLDGTDSLGAAGRAAAVVAAIAPTAAVFVVSEEPDEQTPLRVRRKWRLDMLAEEIGELAAGAATVPCAR
jgi:hypothetical protein